MNPASARPVVGAAAVLVLAATAAPALAGPVHRAAQVEYIDSLVLPAATEHEEVPFGGISGIDHLGDGTFVAISDDRSQHAPARTYDLALEYDEVGFLGDGLTITGTTALQRADGSAFPTGSVDPESVRWDARTGHVLWSDEGDAAALLPPALRESTREGELVREYAIPEEFLPVRDRSGTQVSGVRPNAAFESLTLSPQGNHLSFLTEAALVQDGPVAGPLTSSPVRLTTLNRHNGTVLSQWVYEVSPFQDAAGPGDRGAVELLQISRHEFLVLERQYSEGANRIQLYLASTRGAEDVRGTPALDGSERVMSKTLVADLEVVDVHPDNVEALSWGPDLADGSRSVVLVADDNFSSVSGGSQRTTVHLLRVDAL